MSQGRVGTFGCEPVKTRSVCFVIGLMDPTPIVLRSFCSIRQLKIKVRCPGSTYGRFLLRDWSPVVRVVGHDSSITHCSLEGYR